MQASVVVYKVKKARTIELNRAGKLIKMAESDLEQQLEDEFGMFGFDISGNISVLEKCKYLKFL